MRSIFPINVYYNSYCVKPIFHIVVRPFINNVYPVLMYVVLYVLKYDVSNILNYWDHPYYVQLWCPSDTRSRILSNHKLWAYPILIYGVHHMLLYEIHQIPILRNVVVGPRYPQMCVFPIVRYGVYCIGCILFLVIWSPYPQICCIR